MAVARPVLWFLWLLCLLALSTGHNTAGTDCLGTTDHRNRAVDVVRTNTPCFSWPSPSHSALMTFRLEVICASGCLHVGEVVWDTGAVWQETSASAFVGTAVYDGPPLEPAACYKWSATMDNGGLVGLTASHHIRATPHQHQTTPHRITSHTPYHTTSDLLASLARQDGPSPCCIVRSSASAHRPVLHKRYAAVGTGRGSSRHTGTEELNFALRWHRYCGC